MIDPNHIAKMAAMHIVFKHTVKAYNNFLFQNEKLDELETLHGTPSLQGLQSLFK